MTLLELLFPIFLLVIISVALAVILTITFGVKFWIGFTLTFLAQIIVYNVFRYAFDAIIALKNKKLENERIKEFTYQGLEVTCPCTKKHIDFVPIRLNTPNMYKCGDCNKSVSVFINAETALQTEPITNTDIIETVSNIITPPSTNGTP
jgi:hypothetical protein